MYALKTASDASALPGLSRADLHLVDAEVSPASTAPAVLCRSGKVQGPRRTQRIEAPPAFPDVATMVREIAPDHPVFCVRPDELRRLAQVFSQGFGGTPLYAVKCNPDPFILSTLFEAGIAGFDVASLEEVEQIDSLFGEAAGLFFNNPAKSRQAIRVASDTYGVRYFTVDHPSELEKLIEETRGQAEEIGIAVRVAANAAAARYALSTKFGATPELAAELLTAARKAGFRRACPFMSARNVSTRPPSARPF